MANARFGAWLAGVSLLTLASQAPAQSPFAPIAPADPAMTTTSPLSLPGSEVILGAPLVVSQPTLAPVSMPLTHGAGSGTATESSVRSRPPGDLAWQTLHNRGWQALRGFVPDDEVRQERLQSADTMFRSALERLRPFQPDDKRVATTYQDLAWVFYLKGQYDEARGLAEWALSDREARLGPNHPEVGDSLILLARIATAQDRFADADALARRALALYSRVSVGRQLDFHTPIALDTLGLNYKKQKQFELAEAYVRRALEWRQELYQNQLYAPEKDITMMIELARTDTQLASILRELGRDEEAEILEYHARSLLEAGASPTTAPPAPGPAPF